MQTAELKINVYIYGLKFSKELENLDGMCGERVNYVKCSQEENA
jgi:hypothetical protein